MYTYICVCELRFAGAQFIAMHNKNSVYGITNVKVITDTANWSGHSLGYGASYPAVNSESLMYINATKHFPTVGKKYMSNALYLFRSYEYQQPSGTRWARVQPVDLFDSFFGIMIWLNVCINVYLYLYQHI